MELKDSIKRDSYLPPHATLELGVTLAEMKDFANARTYLEKAKTEYKGFLVEVIVHLRIHAAMREMANSEANLGKKSHSLTTKTLKESNSVINGSNEETGCSFKSENSTENSSKSAPTSPAGEAWVKHPLKCEQL